MPSSTRPANCSYRSHRTELFSSGSGLTRRLRVSSIILSSPSSRWGRVSRQEHPLIPTRPWRPNKSITPSSKTRQRMQSFSSQGMKQEFTWWQRSKSYQLRYLRFADKSHHCDLPEKWWAQVVEALIHLWVCAASTSGKTRSIWSRSTSTKSGSPCLIGLRTALPVGVWMWGL